MPGDVQNESDAMKATFLLAIDSHQHNANLKVNHNPMTFYLDLPQSHSSN
jgi:hypothetical protein